MIPPQERRRRGMADRAGLEPKDATGLQEAQHPCERVHVRADGGRYGGKVARLLANLVGYPQLGDRVQRTHQVLRGCELLDEVERLHVHRRHHDRPARPDHGRLASSVRLTHGGRNGQLGRLDQRLEALAPAVPHFSPAALDHLIAQVSPHLPGPPRRGPNGMALITRGPPSSRVDTPRVRGCSMRHSNRYALLPLRPVTPVATSQPCTAE